MWKRRRHDCVRTVATIPAELTVTAAVIATTEGWAVRCPAAKEIMVTAMDHVSVAGLIAARTQVASALVVVAAVVAECHLLVVRAMITDRKDPHAEMAQQMAVAVINTVAVVMLVKLASPRYGVYIRYYASII